MVIFFVVLFIVYALLGFCTLQILYYGWKEQEHLYHERGQALNFNNQGQPSYQPASQQVEPLNADYAATPDGNSNTIV